MPPAPPPTLQEQKTPPARWYRNPWIIFAVALALRTALIFNFHLYRFATQPHNHFQFGWEMGRIARSIASGNGFANPFHGHTGPTAWVTPLYPYLMAEVFRLLGIYSVASAIALIMLNALIGALTIFPIRTIAARCFSPKLAVASMWIWAAWPFTMRYVSHMRDTSLTMLLFTCVVALSLRMRGIGAPPAAQPALRSWLLLGLLWGIIAVTQPSLLLILPVSFLWILAPSWTRHETSALRTQFARAFLAGLLTAACMIPWMIRNAIVFHTFLPMRSNFWAEMYLGNGPGSNGIVMVYHHPTIDPIQFHLYKQLGELAYTHMRGVQVRAFILTHPAHYLHNILLRFYFCWLHGIPSPTTGNLILQYLPKTIYIFIGISGLLGLALAARNRIPGTGLFATAFLLAPLIYYFAFFEQMFRYSITPLLYILTLYLWTSAEEGYRVRLLSPSWWRARFHA